jgi:hypothetical protein
VFEQIVASTDRFQAEGTDVEDLQRTQRGIIERCGQLTQQSLVFSPARASLRE